MNELNRLQTVMIPGKRRQWTVKLDGKVVGKIVNEDDGYRYYPKGQRRGGDAFPSLGACIDSLVSA